jgi:hypothetical protein
MIGIRKHHIYKKFEREGELNMNKYIELYRKFKELQKANRNENNYDVLIKDKKQNINIEIVG